MKKLFLIFAILFTCQYAIAGPNNAILDKIENLRLNNEKLKKIKSLYLTKFFG